jgi:hypothetical protein
LKTSNRNWIMVIGNVASQLYCEGMQCNCIPTFL